MSYNNLPTITVEAVIELTNELANQIMFDRILGKDVSKDRISTLMRIAIVLHENEIPWPPLLREVISWQVDLVAIGKPSAADACQQANRVNITLDYDGPLRGHIDVCTPGMVMGWAQDQSHPERPVRLEILGGGQIVGEVLAGTYRSDLEIANLGSGKHAFLFNFEPDQLTIQETILIRRSSDKCILGTIKVS